MTRRPPRPRTPRPAAAPARRPRASAPGGPTTLTSAQQRVLDALRDYQARHGYPPATRDLAAMLGLSAPSVHEQLRRLEVKGHISRSRGRARGIALASPAGAESGGAPGRLRAVPILGRVAAGAPILAAQHVTGQVYVDERAVGAGQLFALAVRGTSMVDSGIRDGDLVVVRQQPVAESGDIVAALLGEEATIKRLKVDGARIMLLPDSRAHQPIDVTAREDFRILGKVVTWLRVTP